MNEASVAILFTYKWLHNSGKALDEIEKKANCFDSFCWQFGTTKPPYTTQMSIKQPVCAMEKVNKETNLVFFLKVIITAMFKVFLDGA